MKDSPEDLSARARRQSLSDADTRALEQALETSAEARLWHRVGCEFDEEDIVLPGDHDAAERILQRLMGEVRQNKGRSRRRLGLLLVAAALLIASVAAATVVGLARRDSRTPSLASNGALRAAAPQEAELAPTASETSRDRELPNDAPAPLPQLPRSSAVPPNDATVTPSASASGSTPSVAPDSAAGLLSAAGRARREGYNVRAITLLDSLQARFPNSAEARASDIGLGMLQLKAGSLSSARSHFERYLERSPGGPLVADALWGRAQVLFAQGNDAQARASLTTLLTQFPDSAYASAARAKLRSRP